MKQLSLIAAGLLAASSLVATTARATDFLAAQSDAEYLAKDHLIGAKVHGADGTIVADVEDLIVNDQNQIVGVVMGTGGYFGWAEKKVGVPLSGLKFEEKDGVISVSIPDLTKDVLNSAPEFKRKKPAKSLLERAKEKVNELSDKTTSSTSDAYEKAKPALETAKQKAQEALDKAKEAAAPAIEKAKEAVSGAIDGAKEAVDSTTTPEATPPADSTPAPADSTPPPAPEAPAAPEAPSAPSEPAPAQP